MGSEVYKMHLKGLELEVATMPPPRKVSFTEYCRNVVNSSLRKTIQALLSPSEMICIWQRCLAG